jgi:hypothetical protein
MDALFAVSFHANTSVQSGESSHDQFTLRRRGSGERLPLFVELTKFTGRFANSKLSVRLTADELAFHPILHVVIIDFGNPIYAVAGHLFPM